MDAIRRPFFDYVRTVASLDQPLPPSPLNEDRTPPHYPTNFAPFQNEIRTKMLMTKIALYLTIYDKLEGDFTVVGKPSMRAFQRG